MIYDPDVVLAATFSRFPALPAQSIYYAAEQTFFDRVDEAIAQNLDFTVESNFRDHYLIDVAQRFKDHGYEIGIGYIGLKTVKTSIARVDQRVAQGGHYVDQESIRLNYLEGLANLSYFAARFDHLNIMDGSTRLAQPKPLLIIENQELIYQEDFLPNWSRTTIANILANYPFKNNDLDNDIQKDYGYTR